MEFRRVLFRSPTAGVALKDQADKLARYACQALTELEKFDPELKSIKDRGLKSWYKQHKKADEARIAKELKEKEKQEEQKRLYTEALAKLTPEEIEAFGLNKGKKAPAKQLKWPGFER